MICPHCGELTPPGPLDVRNCAPQSSARNDNSLTMLSRLVRWMLAWRQGTRPRPPGASPLRGTFHARIRESPDEGAALRSRET